MNDQELILELREQIKGWERVIENNEDMIEAAYHRIDEAVERIQFKINQSV